ncbi:30S ribosomal protein S24e [Pyrobaculum neutrophilum]|uniref:30S ribosomal protein S24e n=1 Tax=Pyrobaculum neutrophilum TaxID=70771 RepID=UPI0011E4E2CF|nr:30S ribosomal protein S24e [Pyrobaculum neutrophilum]
MSAPAFNIVSVRENKLLGRRELVVEALHREASTPTRQSVREWVAQQLGVDVVNVLVRKIKTEFGVGRSIAEVHVYSDSKLARAVEPLYVLARNLGEEGKKLVEEAKKRRSARREKRRKRKK